MKPSIKQLSIDSKIIYDRLSQMKKGEAVSYDELTDLIKKDVQREGYAATMTARKMALRENGLVFECITNEGLKALTDTENIESTGKSGFDRIRKISRQSAKKLTAIDDFSNLPPASKIKHNAHLALFGALQAATKEKTVKKIECHTEEHSKISINETIELFK